MIRLNVSTTAMRYIRRYGTFDNYILISKPEHMQSVFGEYLRKLMIEKINNPYL